MNVLWPSEEQTFNWSVLLVQSVSIDNLVYIFYSTSILTQHILLEYFWSTTTWMCRSEVCFPNSALCFREILNGLMRVLVLKGEAFFPVPFLPAKTFIACASNLANSVA